VQSRVHDSSMKNGPCYEAWNDAEPFQMRKRNVSPAPLRPTSTPTPPAAPPCICCGIDVNLWLPLDPSKRWAEIFNIL